jgi:uncharacterized membrane protein
MLQYLRPNHFQEEDMSRKTEKPMQVIVSVFKDEAAARKAAESLKKAQKKKFLNTENVAVITKGTDGKIHFTETADRDFKRGAKIGAVLGGVVGLLAGPAGVVAGGAAGAALSGSIAKLHDSGIADENLENLGRALTGGQAAIVVVLEEEWVDELQAVLAETEAQVVSQPLDPVIARQLTATGSGISGVVQQVGLKTVSDAAKKK